MSFTNHLRTTRLARGMTQQEVAQRSGMNVTQYNAYERGRSRPTPAVLARIAAALQSTPDELLGNAKQVVAPGADLPRLRELKEEYRAKVAEALGLPPASVSIRTEITA